MVHSRQEHVLCCPKAPANDALCLPCGNGIERRLVLPGFTARAAIEIDEAFETGRIRTAAVLA
jgi:hypothetical protein